MFASEEAQEAFFDGDYEEAKRQVLRLHNWIDKTNTKQLLAARGLDHSLIAAYVTIFEARVAATLGEETKKKLERGERIIEDRRNIAMRQGGFPPGLWLAQSEIEFIRGDVLCPERHNIKTDDAGVIIVPFPQLHKQQRLQGRDRIGDYGKWNEKKARLQYIEATDVLERQLGFLFPAAAGFGNNRQQPMQQGGDLNSASLNPDDLGILALSQMIRFIAARAHIELLIIDDQRTPTDRARDAENYFRRLEQLFTFHRWWMLLQFPGTAYPLPYEVFELNALAADVGAAQGGGGPGGGGNAAGDVGTKAVNITERQRRVFKEIWHRTMTDWFIVNSLKGEIEAAVVASKGLESRSFTESDPAEETFRKLSGVVQSQVRKLSHPMVREANRAYQTWLATRVIGHELQNVKQTELKPFVSACRDVIFLCRRTRQVRTQSFEPAIFLLDSYITELQVLEFLYLLERQHKFMTAEQRSELVSAARETYTALKDLAREDALADK